MIKIIKKQWDNGGDIVEFTCTSSADIASLPVDVGVGSTCICTEEENTGVYMLGADNAWHKL